ncbi:MAG TPA: hypothetical protein VEZ11_12045 [Thermoanaerobaculia bacterium]|nr:hypothetical protein [Thermoanaerobaculia bacterium]
MKILSLVLSALLLTPALVAAQPVTSFDLTDVQIAKLRTLTVAWAPVEAGAPCIDPGEDDMGPGIVGLTTAFEILLDNGELKAGYYRWQNRMQKYGEEFAVGEGRDVIRIPQRATESFDFTDDHLALLRRVNTNGLCIDPKRPYGDMTYFYIDMAEILGVPVTRDAKGQPQFTSEQTSRFERLHREMLFALQVFLQMAEIKPGHFVMNSKVRKWERSQ